MFNRRGFLGTLLAAPLALVKFGESKVVSLSEKWYGKPGRMESICRNITKAYEQEDAFYKDIQGPTNISGREFRIPMKLKAKITNIEVPKGY